MSLITGPDILRLILLAGLFIHKLLWEVLKRESRIEGVRRPSHGVLKRMIKAGKAFALILLVLQTAFVNVLPITDAPSACRTVGMMIYVIGLATAMLGRLELGKNWKDIEDLNTGQQEELATDGLYGFIRHPIYVGDMLLLVGLELALNSWLVLAVSLPILVFTRQAVLEEAVLARRFQNYSAYCQRTKRFIPFII